LHGTSQDRGHAELVTRMGAERIRSRERLGDLAGQFDWEPTFDIDRCQLLLLDVWMRLELSAFLVEVGSLNVSLRADRYVFACGHRHSACDQGGYGRREDETGRGSSSNHTDRDARDRNNSIVGAEYGGSQPSRALPPVTDSSDGTRRARSIRARCDLDQCGFSASG